MMQVLPGIAGIVYREEDVFRDRLPNLCGPGKVQAIGIEVPEDFETCRPWLGILRWHVPPAAKVVRDAIGDRRAAIYRVC